MLVKWATEATGFLYKVVHNIGRPPFQISPSPKFLVQTFASSFILFGLHFSKNLLPCWPAVNRSSTLKSFLPRAIFLWNVLPVELQAMKSVYSFSCFEKPSQTHLIPQILVISFFFRILFLHFMLVVVLSYLEHNYYHFLVHTTTPPLNKNVAW